MTGWVWAIAGAIVAVLLVGIGLTYLSRWVVARDAIGDLVEQVDDEDDGPGDDWMDIAESLAHHHAKCDCPKCAAFRKRARAIQLSDRLEMQFELPPT